MSILRVRLRKDGERVTLMLRLRPHLLRALMQVVDSCQERRVIVREAHRCYELLCRIQTNKNIRSSVQSPADFVWTPSGAGSHSLVQPCFNECMIFAAYRSWIPHNPRLQPFPNLGVWIPWYLDSMRLEMHSAKFIGHELELWEMTSSCNTWDASPYISVLNFRF